ncbi:hypothetical protein AVEN_187495-1 [Araneus ventricosus]|uniref:Uncharacterized protein n=1 Tax=Araneus ventricosus TaxID=182803 RepID=A0A4Y2BU50_ARAVE|nr:hypothetical protein AVEN_187495-1 [Araneus ventricosus]
MHTRKEEVNPITNLGIVCIVCRKPHEGIISCTFCVLWTRVKGGKIGDTQTNLSFSSRMRPSLACKTIVDVAAFIESLELIIVYQTSGKENRTNGEVSLCRLVCLVWNDVLHGIVTFQLYSDGIFYTCAGSN